VVLYHPSGSDLPTVVLVDDDEATLNALQRTFRSEPYQVLATPDPFEAWSWIKSRRVALVIADEFMPAVLGTELLEATRRHSPRCAQAILTGYPHTTVVSRAFQQDIDLLIVKPWEDEALRTSVRKLLAGDDAPSRREPESAGDDGAG
jgi:DNA-binding NtrC family response regulator